MGYASREEHALVDQRLFVPEEWGDDKERRKKCGVPKDVRHETRHDLALDMLRKHKARLPHAWVAGDTEMGRSTRGSGLSQANARAVSPGRAVEHYDPGHRRETARVLRKRREAQARV